MNENDEYMENPFSEEFDIDDVVNSKKSDDLEDFEQKTRQQLLDDKDIQDIIDIDDDARRAVSFLEAFGNEEKWESSVIKKEDPRISEDVFEADLEELSEYSKKINEQKFSIEDIDDFDDIENESDIPENDSEYAEDELGVYQKESRRKRESFKDYLQFPKISGREKKLESGKHIPAEAIKDRHKHVEIIDDPKHVDDHEKTLVEINRDENGEIESISIYCKCGEKTLIEFDYLNDDENKTEVINNPLTEEPFKSKDEIEIKNTESSIFENIDIPSDIDPENFK